MEAIDYDKLLGVNGVFRLGRNRLFGGITRHVAFAFTNGVLSYSDVLGESEVIQMGDVRISTGL